MFRVTSLWWLLWAQADYELNPYRRRGGEERVPMPASSVVGHRLPVFLRIVKAGPA